MTDKIMILGGYGNFGKRIAEGLIVRCHKVIIAGRDVQKAEALCARLGHLARPVACDIANGFTAVLAQEKPKIVIHTCGPFQGADYAVAEAAIAAGCHYIDLSDGRDFVTGFGALDAMAKQKDVVAITGASSVPALSSAVIEAHKSRFSKLIGIEFAIAPGQGAERGLATTKAILSYAGKPLKPYAGYKNPYGWQGLRAHRFPELGLRLLSDCDIPDLDLLPQHYGFETIRFGAGLELWPLHLGLWAISGLVRWGAPLRLKALAPLLLKAAGLFDRFGSDDGGMWVRLRGLDHDQKPLTLDWHLIAKAGDGPQIPCVPAILLADRLMQNDPTLPKGAYPCVGIIALPDYLEALKGFQIKTH